MIRRFAAAALVVGILTGAAPPARTPAQPGPAWDLFAADAWLQALGLPAFDAGSLDAIAADPLHPLEPVPEPATAFALALGLAGLAFGRRRRG